MYIHMMKSKLHKAKVTEANLNYVGSITIDKELMESANILSGEKVQVVNNTNGQRFETYTIEGEAKSGVICLNGAAARLVQPGDEVIIISYCMLTDDEARTFKPKVVILDKNNKIIQIDNTEKANTTLD